MRGPLAPAIPRTSSPISCCLARLPMRFNKTTPQHQAAAPLPPQIETGTSTSTSSLIDVDAPSVRTVPSDFAEQDVQTDTQARRQELEHEAEEAAEKLRAEASLAKKKAETKARQADGWLTKKFASLTDGESKVLVAANTLAVLGLGGFLGYRGWGLYERGRLDWKTVGLGLGGLGVVGALEGVLARYVWRCRRHGTMIRSTGMLIPRAGTYTRRRAARAGSSKRLMLLASQLDISSH